MFRRITMKTRRKRRNVRIAIRLNREEKDALVLKAKEHGMTVSQLVRSAVVKIRVIQPNRQLLYEINRAGVNIIRISKHCNCAKAVDLAVLNQLVTIETLLRNLL
jgi:hypothetical protein